MGLINSKKIAAVLQTREHFFDLRMNHRSPALIDQEILLRHISDIRPLFVFCEQVIEGLILMRADLLGNRLPPFFGVGKLRIDIEYDASERMDAVAYDLADMEFGGAGNQVVNEQAIE